MSSSLAITPETSRSIPSHILLIGIETETAAVLETSLYQQGYRVSQVDTLNPLSLQQLRPDLMIMGLSTAGKPDLDLCRHLSLMMKKIPIILLGGNNMQDRIAGLSVCAIDYLSIPLVIEEFLARVRAKLRRIRWEHQAVLFEFAGLRLDDQAHEVHHDNQLIQLTAKEFDLLKYLMTHPQQVLTHQQILDAVWPDVTLKNSANMLHVYIRCLRRKLDSASDLIQTVRGMGYVLKESPTSSKLSEA